MSHHFRRKRRFAGVRVKRLYSAKKIKSKAFAFFCFAAVLLIVMSIADIKIRPFVITASENAIKEKINEYINDALCEPNEDYEGVLKNLVSFLRDDYGNVKAVSFDTASVNKYKNSINVSIAEKLSHKKRITVGVPIGSLFENETFYGRGFTVYVSVYINAFTVNDIVSEFSAAGINQTLHKMYIRSSADISAGTVFRSAPLNVQTKTLLSETIVVGDVPDNYLTGKISSD